jgi:ABC-type dipeptide/oligopeptide/nickel transport system permease component
VEVPAGRHEVVWEYRPLSFALGLALALPAMAIAVVAGAVSALRRRR